MPWVVLSNLCLPVRGMSEGHSTPGSPRLNFREFQTVIDELASGPYFDLDTVPGLSEYLKNSLLSMFIDFELKVAPKFRETIGPLIKQFDVLNAAYGKVREAYGGLSSTARSLYPVLLGYVDPESVQKPVRDRFLRGMVGRKFIEPPTDSIDINLLSIEAAITEISKQQDGIDRVLQTLRQGRMGRSSTKSGTDYLIERLGAIFDLFKTVETYDIWSELESDKNINIRKELANQRVEFVHDAIIRYREAVPRDYDGLVLVKEIGKSRIRTLLGSNFKTVLEAKKSQ